MRKPGNRASVEGRLETRITLRPIGSALPLGFFSFGLGMFMLAGAGIGWIPVREEHDVGLILVTFVAPLELLATVIAFLARDSIGAATLGLFTGSWFSTGWGQLLSQPGARSRAFGMLVLCFAAVIALLAYMAWQAKPFFTVILSGSLARMVVYGAWQFGASSGWLKAAGWIAFALGVLAFYGGVALGMEDAQQREVLPTFRRGAAKKAIEGSLEEQLERLTNEPGVRQQL
jgi:succinate-acetate transporter protein